MRIARTLSIGSLNTGNRPVLWSSSTFCRLPKKLSAIGFPALAHNCSKNVRI